MLLFVVYELKKYYSVYYVVIFVLNMGKEIMENNKHKERIVK
jgi:hypothetical protein